MKNIEVSADVFALIWRLRIAPEATEDAILGRILRALDQGAAEVKTSSNKVTTDLWSTQEVDTSPDSKESVMLASGDQAMPMGKIRWVDDVVSALQSLGGTARLSEIYRKVEDRRRAANRSVPPSLEATIRRTLEDFSEDSENFRGENLFCMPEGKGAGLWALRKRK